MTALESRLSRICCTRMESPRTASFWMEERKASRWSLRSVSGRMIWRTVFKVSLREKELSLRPILPDSILDISSTSLIRPSRWLPER